MSAPDDVAFYEIVDAFIVFQVESFAVEEKRFAGKGIVVRRPNVGVEGETNRLTFITAALPDRSTWAALSVTDAPPTPQQDLRLVTYALRIVEGEDGSQSIDGVETDVQKLLTVRIAEEGEDEPITSVLLSPDVMFVRFRYWDGSAWQTSWSGAEMPAAVEIAMGAEPLEAGGDPENYSHEMARRVVWLALTTVQQSSTMIRGLGGGN